ncbi:MAG: hypothetical protein ACTSR2_01145 [Candidatus Hodarchaeales archaeon]
MPITEQEITNISQELQKWEIETKDIFVDLLESLSGLQIIELPTGQLDVRRIPGIDPLLPLDGAMKIISMLRGIVNKNLFLSNLDEKMIAENTKHVGIKVATMLYMNWDEWELTIPKADATVEVVVNTVYSAMRRAFNESEKKYRKTIIKAETRSEVIPQKEKHSRLPFLGKS